MVQREECARWCRWERSEEGGVCEMVQVGEKRGGRGVRDGAGGREARREECVRWCRWERSEEGGVCEMVQVGEKRGGRGV